MISNFLNIFFQTILFILLFVQSTLIYLSLSCTGIPIPPSLIQKYVPEDLNLTAKEILFFLPFHLKLIEPEFTQKADTLLQLDSPEIFVSWRPNLKGFVYNQWNILSYSGKVNSKFYPSPLDLNQLNLVLNGSQIQNARLHLKSDDKVVCLSYTSDKRLSQNDEAHEQKKPTEPTAILSPLINENSPLFTIIRAFHASKNSFIECFLERTSHESFKLSTMLSSESINVFNNKLESFQIQISYSSDSSEHSVYFQAEDFSSSQISIQSNAIIGQLKLDDQMQIDSIEINTGPTRLKSTVIDSISAKVAPKNTDCFSLDGTLFHKNHLLNILGDYQINTPQNTFLIKAHLNLNELQKDYFPQFENYEIESSNSIFTDTEIILGKNFNLLEARGIVHGEGITINSTPLQYLSNDFQWINKRLKASSLFRINQRDSSLNTVFNAESGDYTVILFGSTFSSDFYTLLPKWWENTFSDFSYTDNTKCFHDFAIYGTLNSPIPDFLLGSVQTENIYYKGVPVKYGDVLVKGKNYCTEITLRDIQTEAGNTKGVIKITIKPDGFRKPESVRTKLKSELTIKTAEKLFGNDIQQILSNFESPFTHKVDFESVFFNPYYTQHNNKSYYNLSIGPSNPILFFKRPFNQLSAEIYGRNAQHYIRSAEAEFASGRLNFEADILETLSEDPQIRINLSLSDCDYSQSIKDAFQNEFINTSINESLPLTLNLNLKSKGSLLDLTKHNGYGNFEINGAGLGKIHLLGPLSKALDELNLSIGVFSLDHLESDFIIQNEWIDVQNLEINGKQSNVLGTGKIWIPDQSINFKMEVDLLKNRNLSFSKLGSLGKFLDPVTKIFNFRVTGTLQDQKWRSIFDPRNLFQ